MMFRARLGNSTVQTRTERVPELLADVARECARAEWISAAARAGIAGAEPGTEGARLRALVRHWVTYTREWPERIVLPARLLETGAGDCDDMVILLGALLTSLQQPALIAVGYDAEGHPVHTWIELRGRVLDATSPADPHSLGELYAGVRRAPILPR